MIILDTQKLDSGICASTKRKHQPICLRYHPWRIFIRRQIECASTSPLFSFCHRFLHFYSEFLFIHSISNVIQTFSSQTNIFHATKFIVVAQTYLTWQCPPVQQRDLCRTFPFPQDLKHVHTLVKVLKTKLAWFFWVFNKRFSSPRVSGSSEVVYSLNQLRHRLLLKTSSALLFRLELIESKHKIISKLWIIQRIMRAGKLEKPLFKYDLPKYTNRMKENQ